VSGILQSLVALALLLPQASHAEGSAERAFSASEQVPAGAGVAEVDYDPLFDELDAAEEQADTADPLESTNRAVFAFNRGVDRAVLGPLTRGYQATVPGPARAAFYRAFRNLKAPSIFVNDLLQLRFKDAGKTLGRFLLNSTIGAAGLFDAGIEMGWEPHAADFGQTLGHYGVDTGPYLVLPLLGPSTVRDGVGFFVDGLFQPLTYIIGPGQLLTVALPIGGGRGLTMRDRYSNELQALEESSVDFYAAMRSAYLQSRDAHISAVRNRTNP